MMARLALALVATTALSGIAKATDVNDDPYTWLEDIDGQIAALTVPSPDAEIPQSLIGDLVQQSEALKQKIQMLTSNPDWEPCSKLLATLEIDFPPGPQADGGAGFHPARTAS